MNQKTIRRFRELLDAARVPHFISTDEITGLKSIAYFKGKDPKGRIEWGHITGRTRVEELPF